MYSCILSIGVILEVTEYTKGMTKYTRRVLEYTLTLSVLGIITYLSIYSENISPSMVR